MVTRDEIIKRITEGEPMRKVMGHQPRFRRMKKTFGDKRLKKNRKREGEEAMWKTQIAKDNLETFLKKMEKMK